MLNLGSVMKMAKGSLDPEVLRSMLASMGMNLQMIPVTLADAPGELRGVAAAAGRRGASLHRLTGSMKDGSTLEAFIVFAPSSRTTVSAVTKSAKIAA
jgi:hypothetical protein